MNKNESEILEVLNGLGSKKLDLDILFSYYSLKLSFEIRKFIAEKIGMQEGKGYFLLEKMIKKFGLKVEFIEALKLTNEKVAKDLLLKNLYQNNKLNIHIINALEPWGGEIELTLIREIFDICEIDFWIAGLNILHFKAHQLSDEILLSFKKSTIPETNGCSGPTTTKSILFFLIIFNKMSKFKISISKFVAIFFVPAFPGIQNKFFIFLDCLSL